MTRWIKTSASQIKNHQDCNSKWFFDKIVFPTEINEGSASTRLGKDVHTNIENHLNKGTPLDHPLLAQNLYIPTIMLFSGERRVEWEFMDKESFPVAAHGFIDLVLVDREARTVEVIDHKTTKDWKYAKTEAELRDDAQCLLYLWQAYKEFGDTYTYSFAHHVIHTVKAAPERITRVSVSVEQIKQGKLLLERDVNSMLLDSEALDHSFVDKNYGSCYKYGKCSFFDYCKGNKKVGSNIGDVLGQVAPKKLDGPAEYSARGTGGVPIAATTTIYVDCLPLGQDITWFEDWVQDLAKAYEIEVKEHYLATKYNEGAKALALQAHKQVLEGKRILPPGLVIRSGNAAGNFFEAFHTGHCKIVKGIR